MFNNLTKKQKTIFTLIPITFISLIIIISILVIQATPNQSKIQNFNELNTTISKKDRDRINKTLTALLQSNYNISDNDTIDDIYIRIDTYKETISNDITTATFIVDINSIQQSFIISLEYSETNKKISNDISISCPTLEQTKYPESTCISEGYSTGELSIYLPFRGTTKSGNEITIKQQYYISGESYLEISVNSCGDESIQNEALESAKKWVDSLHVNPEDYIYYVIPDLCDGEAG